MNTVTLQLNTISALKAFYRDLISLTKPGIMLLLLISTICPMLLANPEVSWFTILATFVGGALVSGSASAMNCVWDMDIDAVMRRTSDRPIPAGRLSYISALIFAGFLGVAGLFILAFFTNLLAAFIALVGHLFYVVIYTMWLKRWTAQNIVIGGAAGAFPPMVGWAAATGQINLTAFLLFMIVFLWTPPHFWALALVKNEDYKRAKVPMMPLVKGPEHTRKEMLIYCILLIPCTYLLIISDQHLAWFSYFSLGLINLIFTFKTYQLLKNPSEKQSWRVFGFSLIYLGVFFATLVIDSIFI